MYKAIQIIAIAIELNGQESVQHESRLKIFRPCTERRGQAPVITEARRRPNMRGATRRTQNFYEDKVEIVPMPPVEFNGEVESGSAVPEQPDSTTTQDSNELYTSKWQPVVVLERLPEESTTQLDSTLSQCRVSVEPSNIPSQLIASTKLGKNIMVPTQSPIQVLQDLSIVNKKISQLEPIHTVFQSAKGLTSLAPPTSKVKRLLQDDQSECGIIALVPPPMEIPKGGGVSPIRVAAVNQRAAVALTTLHSAPTLLPTMETAIQIHAEAGEWEDIEEVMEIPSMPVNKTRPVPSPQEVRPRSTDSNRVPPRRTIVPNQRWVGPQIRQAIMTNRRSNRKRCCICQYKCSMQARQEEHIRRHFSRMFCRCGFGSGNADGIQRHQQSIGQLERDRAHGDQIFKVDAEHYTQWARYVGLRNPPPFSGPVAAPPTTVTNRLGPRASTPLEATVAPPVPREMTDHELSYLRAQALDSRARHPLVSVHRPTIAVRSLQTDRSTPHQRSPRSDTTVLVDQIRRKLERVQETVVIARQAGYQTERWVGDILSTLDVLQLGSSRDRNCHSTVL